MRSGRYALASVLLHLGDSHKDGHFVSVCSQGPGNYVECNDAEVSSLTWDQVAVPKTWQNAYVLIYVRRVAMVSAAVSASANVSTPHHEEASLPQFPPMSEADAASARNLKAAAAERRREEARMRGIGNLTGTRKTATTQLAKDAVAAMQRQRTRQASKWCASGW